MATQRPQLPGRVRYITNVSENGSPMRTIRADDAPSAPARPPRRSSTISALPRSRPYDTRSAILQWAGAVEDEGAPEAAPEIRESSGDEQGDDDDDGTPTSAGSSAGPHTVAKPKGEMVSKRVVLPNGVEYTVSGRAGSLLLEHNMISGDDEQEIPVTASAEQATARLSFARRAWKKVSAVFRRRTRR